VTGLLDRRRVLVTGSAGGIGGAIAAECRAQGGEVLGLDRVQGGPVPVVVVDLADTKGLGPALDDVMTRLGGVDVLVNCAGTFRAERALDLSWESYQHTLHVNLHSPVFLMSRLGAGMSEAGYGRIVNVTSIHGRLSEPLSAAYDVSKAGLEAATRTFAIELAASGVLVNAVAPGFVRTAMSLVDGVDELESDWFRTIYVEHGRLPLGRAAETDEIARHVSFLASDQNTYLTGQVITIDGGLSARF
jgi:NAD(P)-dependent dehydrogenase (short-subunit alcohol dehydrogenase family)